MEKGLLRALSQSTGTAGEEVVANLLRRDGWINVQVDTRGPGSTDVLAQRPNGGGILVQVKSAISPNEPSALGALEQHEIAVRANRLGYDAYAAAVTFSPLGLAAPTVQWQRLN